MAKLFNMNKVSVASEFGVAPSDERPHLNTGTTVDVHMGAFLPTIVPGSQLTGTALSGGLAPTNGSTGNPHTWKSSGSMCRAVNAMALMPGSQMIHADMENVVVRQRVANMNIHTDVTPSEELLDRITIGSWTMEDFMVHVGDIIEFVKKNQKDRVVETPFRDRHGKAIRIFVPLFIGIDPISSMLSREIEEKKLKTEISDTAQNPIQMQEALVKTRFTDRLFQMCQDYGVYLSMVAQMVEVPPLNPHAAPQRTLPGMQPNKKFSGAGKGFERKMSTLIENRLLRALEHETDRTQPKYPTAHGRHAASEHVLINSVVTRCKYHSDGHMIPQVYAKTNGSEVPYLTAYEVMQTSKAKLSDGQPASGLSPAGQYLYECNLYPGHKFGRTTIFDAGANDYKLRRALQIAYEHFVISTTWTIPRNYPKAFLWDTRTVYEKLLSGGADMDAILESRGWWTYNCEWEKKQRPYISTMDVMAMASGEYTPKMLQVILPWAIKKTAVTV